MVESRHPPASARAVRFQPPSRAPRLVDCLSLRALFGRMPAAHWQRVEVPQFHLWIHVFSGHTTHLVDFERYPARAGTVVHVRPGQLHRWDPRPGLEGHALLVDLHGVAAPRPGPARGSPDDLIARWPTVRAIRAGERARCAAWFHELLRSSAIADEAAAEGTRTLLWHLAMVALLDVERSAQGEPVAQVIAPKPDPDRRRLQRFRSLLERSYFDTRKAADYARALRCSTRTLDRTTLAIEGRTAKELIDARVLLEAKRRLAHLEAPLEELGGALGFSEATNFVKFFRRLEGTTPAAFRARYRGRAAQGT